MKIIVIKIVIIVKIIIAITTNKIKLKILGGLIQLIIQKKFTIADGNFERELFGNFDENVKLIEKTLNIDVILRRQYNFNWRRKKCRFCIKTYE